MAKDEPEPDYSFAEYNSDPSLSLHEVDASDFALAPDTLQMFLKLYAHYNPEEIIAQVAALPALEFDKKLQQLPDFYLNYTYNEMEEATVPDSRYVISRFCPPRFKVLMDKVLEKVPIYGWTVPMHQYAQLQELEATLSKDVFSFLYGEGVFFDEHERSLYRRALVRQVSSGDWLDGRDIPFVTESEDCFLLGMVNWPGVDDYEHTFQYRPFFREFHIESEYFYREPQGALQKLSRLIWYRNTYK